MKKKSYKVDLNAYLAECELNYWRVIRILRGTDGDERTCLLVLPEGLSTQINFCITQRCKFTTMLDITQQSTVKWFNYKIELRLYHDVKASDITAFQGHKRIWPSYQYPNRQMYQKDEKFQQQSFLSQCLSSCLESGFLETDIVYVKGT